MGKENNRFSKEIKNRVRREQEGRCDYCGRKACLQIHHIKPRCQHGAGTRDNAVGLCPKCHAKFDELALNENKYYNEVIMEEGKEYKL